MSASSPARAPSHGVEIALRHRQGAFTLDVEFASDARLIALFGRSGCGKTTLARAVAGLIRPAEGRIVIDGRVLFDSRAGLCLPAWRRRIGVVFQEARLFPHLSVRQNLLYGRLFAPRGRQAARLDAVVDMLGIGHLAGRRPAMLSGGEKARVAIGRALLSDPAILIMDEPFAALDEARRQEILPHVERLRDEAGLPILYVSHSVSEVVRLAPETVALVDGRISAIGRTADVLGSRAHGGEPGTVLEGIVAGDDEAAQDRADGLSRVATPAGPLLLPRVRTAAGRPLRLFVPARDVTLALARPAGISALNVLAGTVETVTEGAEGMDIGVRCGAARVQARITRRSCRALGLAPGSAVFALIKAVALDQAGG